MNLPDRPAAALGRRRNRFRQTYCAVVEDRGSLGKRPRWPDANRM